MYGNVVPNSICCKIIQWLDYQKSPQKGEFGLEKNQRNCEATRIDCSYTVIGSLDNWMKARFKITSNPLSFKNEMPLTGEALSHPLS